MSNQTIWTGKSSSTWSDHANWTQGVPSLGIHAIIPKVEEKCFSPVIASNLKINFTLKNDGHLIIESQLFVMNNGIIQNYGTIKIENIGTLENEGNVLNFGECINEGTIENKKVFSSKHRLFNDGLIDNKNTFVNLGSIVNTGVIDNYNIISNHGAFENFNIVENHGEGQVQNKGFLPEAFINEVLDISGKSKLPERSALSEQRN